LNRGDIKSRLSPTYYQALQHAQIHSKFHKKRLSSLVDTASGGTPSKNKAEYWVGDIGWISPKDIKDFYIQSAEDSISQQAIDDSSTRLVPAGSVVIVVRSGILAHTLPVSVLSKEFAINQDIKALMTKSDEILPDYLAVFLTIFQQRLLPIITKHSTTVQSVNSYEFLRLEIVCPPGSIQANIIESFQNALKQKSQQEAQAQALLDSIDGYLLGKLGITLPPEPDNTIANRVFKTSWRQVSGGRFDPKRYSTYIVQLLNVATTSSVIKTTLKSLITHSVAGDWGYDENEELDSRLFEKRLVIRSTEFDNDFNLNLDGSRTKFLS
jgi:restriction endonuclease S subunit